MSYVSSLLDKIFSLTYSLDTTGWAVIAVVLVGVGFLCMQGYGSRANY